MEERVQRRLAAILAGDVVGYSRLMSDNEERTLAALTGHLKDLIEPCIAEHHGRVVKTTGDGVLVEFSSVVNAVTCSIAVQEGMVGRNSKTPKDQRIEFRIGVNLGDVIVQDGDVFGDGVNIAARLEGLAEPGGICVSNMVLQGVRGKLDLVFDDMGPQRVKNIGEPVRAYKIDIRRSQSDAIAAAKDAPPLPARPSIAVLPFENMSADPDQEYFSDGITEDIITELSKISGLFVIARHSAFTFKGQSVSLKHVGRELGVRYVLEGSVRKSGNRLRITAQLIDASTDHHLWAERFDREVEDIFAVQEEVARQVAAAMKVALKPEESARLAHAPTENLGAYELYLRTRMTFWPPGRDNILNAQIGYQSVIEADPTFAGGFAGKSIAHSMSVIYRHSTEPDIDARIALELADKATTMDDDFALSHSAIAMAFSSVGRHEEAVAAAQRAVALQPGDGDSYMFLSVSLSFAGRFEEAREAALLAHRIDPKFAPSLYALGRAYFMLGRYEESNDVYELATSQGMPLAAPMLISWIVNLYKLDRLEEAKEKAQNLLRYRPDFIISRTSEVYPFGEEVMPIIIDSLRNVGLPE
jgi:adenylate cyclase